MRYRKDAFPAEDYRFWADCSTVTRFHNVQKVLFHYRMHETQICTSLKEIQVGKADEVRRLMLDWLSEDMTDADRNYFLNSFVLGEIHDRKTLDERREFARKLCRLNLKHKHYDNDALRRGLSNRIRLGVYSTAISDYFESGYSLKAYRDYLKSGVAFNAEPKLEAKLLIKSVLGRS